MNCDHVVLFFSLSVSPSLRHSEHKRTHVSTSRATTCCCWTREDSTRTAPRMSPGPCTWGQPREDRCCEMQCHCLCRPVYYLVIRLAWLLCDLPTVSIVGRTHSTSLSHTVHSSRPLSPSFPPSYGAVGGGLHTCAHGPHGQRHIPSRNFGFGAGRTCPPSIVEHRPGLSAW